MSPATHAVLGAAIAGTAPRLWIALPLAFLSHFVCDAIYHFEAFYPLSQKLGVSHSEAFAVTVAVLGLALLPALWVLARRGPRVAPVLSLPSGGEPVARGGGNLPVGPAACSSRACFSVLGFGASLPLGTGRVRGQSAGPGPLGLRTAHRLHIVSHYEGMHDLGDVIYRLVRKQPSLFVGDRFDDPYYVLGYVIEIAVEVSLLWGGLYWMTSRRRGVARKP